MTLLETLLHFNQKQDVVKLSTQRSNLGPELLWREPVTFKIYSNSLCYFNIVSEQQQPEQKPVFNNTVCSFCFYFKHHIDQS